MTIWSLALTVLFAVAMSYIIVIAKKMNTIIELLKNKDKPDDKK